MTKVIKWYKRMGTWEMLLKIIAPITIGGEFAVYFTNSNPIWHGVVLAAGMVSFYVKTLFTDKDGNGIVDQFESKEKKEGA